MSELKGKIDFTLFSVIVTPLLSIIYENENKVNK